MESNIKVSVVMVTYNHERFIAQALDSILMQKTDVKYEIIIGEDCSPDRTRSIIMQYEQKYPDIIKPIYRDENIGMIKNLLDCLKRCKGKYIAMLEGDDYWTDANKLQIQVSYLDSHPDTLAIAHNYDVVDIERKFLYHGLNNKELIHYGKKEIERFEQPGQVSAWMYRSECIEYVKSRWRSLRPYMWIPVDRTIPIVLLHFGKITLLPYNMSCYRYYVEENGTNWASKRREIGIKKYCYMLGMESLAKKMELDIDLIMPRMKLFCDCGKSGKRAAGLKKLFSWIQQVLMILLSKKPVRFLKLVKEARK